jgi:hypothetical protein
MQFVDGVGIGEIILSVDVGCHPFVLLFVGRVESRMLGVGLWVALALVEVG